MVWEWMAFFLLEGLWVTELLLCASVHLIQLVSEREALAHPVPGWP